MAKTSRTEKVSDGFSDYLKEMQANIKKDTGKDISRRDITAIIAAQKPVIKVEIKKKGSIFDF